MPPPFQGEENKYIPPDQKAFPTLKEQELPKIVERRKKAGLPPEEGDATAKSLVGLALSGGGIRSASFNLGLLQALLHHGALRHVDYLATVSGGSYIGARFSSEVQGLAKNEALGPDNLPMKAEPNGQQNDDVKEILKAGRSLTEVLRLANRYFIGLAKINLVLGSLVLAVCAFLALVWRFLDDTPINETILMLTGGTLFELVRPFLFTFVFLLAWALGWGLSSRPGHGARAWSLCLGVEAILLLVTLGWQQLETAEGIDRDSSFFLTFFTRLHPDIPLWCFLRPLPFLLTFAWPLAWAATSPGAVADGGEGRPRRGWVRWLLLGLIVGAGLIALVWRFGEVRGWFGLPAQDLLWLVLRPVPFLVVICVPVYWLLLTWRSEPRSLDEQARLRWLLLLAGASFLVGWAVWLATPNVAMSSKDMPVDTGYIVVSRTVLQTLLALLVGSLLPLLRPKRLVQGWLRPKRFWEPWLFYAGCTAFLIGIPLLGVWFFASHNISGQNAARESEILPYDLTENFWRRAKNEAQRPVTDDEFGPAGWVWEKLRQKDRNTVATVDEYLKPKTLGSNNPLRPKDFGDLQFKIPKQVTEVLSEEPPKRLLLLAVKKVRRSFPPDLKPDSCKWSTNPEQEVLGAFKQAPGSFPPDLANLLTQQVELVLRTKDGSPLREEEKEAERNLNGKINRRILELTYPADVSSHTLVRRSPLILHDQLARFGWLVVLLLIFFPSAWLLKINGTSLHHFYRDQLAGVYIRRKPEPRPGAREYLLEEMDNVARGAPYPLICATFNAFRIHDLLVRLVHRVESHGREASPDGDLSAAGGTAAAGQGGAPSVPSPRAACSASPAVSLAERDRTDTFIFSPLYCGCEATGYCPTQTYRYGDQRLYLSEVAALSGAAFSPAQSAGPFGLFMTVLNLRLGQWLPSPRPKPPWHQPSIWDLLNDGAQRLDQRRYFFVSDGGHHENLGLGVLLGRRCRLIILSDATADAEYNFDDFLRLCRRERLDHGIRFLEVVGARSGQGEDVRLDVVRPRVYCSDYEKSERPERKNPGWLNKDWLSKRHYFIARIAYPDDGPSGQPVGPFDQEAKEAQANGAPGQGAEGEPPCAYLVYLKPSLTGDEENDLKRHWAKHPAFPHDPTSDQFYDEDTVESYRQLGYHIGEDFCRRLLPSGKNLWNVPSDIHRLMKELVEQLGKEPQGAPEDTAASTASEAPLKKPR